MPYRPKFSITAHLLRMIEESASLREKILNAAIQVPWIPSLQKEARVRNTHSSTAIEGNPLTLEEVRALEEGRDVIPASERSKREILNYLAGLRFIEKRSSQKTIGARDVLKLHSLMATGVMDQGRPGSYRAIAVRVGSYFPPPASDVPRLMAELLEWWNEESSKWSPVVSSAILHYRFEEIHPFADGNGRVGRGLALWELYRREFDTHHIFSIDEVYWENRPRYYQALSDVQRQKADLSGWLEYCAEALHLTLERVWTRIQRLSAEIGEKKIVLRPRQEKLLGLLRDRKSMSPREIWKALGVSKQGALDLLKPLMEAGLIKRVGTKKTGKYVLA